MSYFKYKNYNDFQTYSNQFNWWKRVIGYVCGEPKIAGWQNQMGAKLVTMESAAVTKAVLTGKVGGVTVIDFDSVPAYILFTMDFPFLGRANPVAFGSSS